MRGSVTRFLVRALLVGLCLVHTAFADISVRARLDRTQARVGDPVDLAVEINGAQNTPAPSLSSPDGLSVRYVGPSTQVSIVNGQMSASVTHHFSVAALKEGTFTLGPIRVEYNGKTYDAGTVSLQGLAAGARAPAQGGAPSGEQLRLVMSTPKTEVYLHERIPLTVKLLVGNVRVADLQYPTIAGDGFGLDKFPEPQQRQEQTAQGAFQVVDFATALTPLRSGSLTVGPVKMPLSVLTRRRGGDMFFDQFFGAERRPLELQSEALTLTVLPLPDTGKPADFSGAVGHFDFEVKAAPLELNVGDPVTVTMTIRGVGNLENVATPAIAASDALKVYPAQAQAGHSAQEKVFEQVVIPQQMGATLPELRFSFFDPETRAYQTITRPAIALTVRASAQAQAAPQIVGAAPVVAPTPRSETLGRDIVFIKDAPGEFTPIGARSYRSVWFWLYQPLPLLGWIAAVLYDRRRSRLRGDVRYARFTRAGREARQAIAAARSVLQAGNQAAFYDAVARAVSEYLSAKLDLPPGSVTADTAAERLRARGLSPQVAGELQEFFATCERVRFAPSASSDGDMQRTIERADAIVQALERERGLARSMAALAALALLAGIAVAATSESPNTVFFHANGLYSEEHYADAAKEYERILSGGRDSANLYFNLGNAHFKAGDVGRAILNYERARRLIPRDPDVHANLEYARSLSDPAEETPIYARLLFPLAERMSSDELLIAASVAYTLLMLLLTVGRLMAPAQRTAFVASAGVAVVLVLALSSGVYRLLTLDLPTYAIVVAPTEQTVRFEPSANGTAHYAAKPGALLRVVAEREGWLQVARFDNQRGWIEAAAVAKL
ncbi:MAG TPA: BatD family protein [Candidatus Binatia bacterium]|nr:BatD family protein [Candidatus Binatia bacterium]